MKKTRRVRPDYLVELRISDSGDWPRIPAYRLMEHVRLELPAGLFIWSKNVRLVKSKQRQLLKESK